MPSLTPNSACWAYRHTRWELSYTRWELGYARSACYYIRSARDYTRSARDYTRSACDYTRSACGYARSARAIKNESLQALCGVVYRVFYWVRPWSVWSRITYVSTLPTSVWGQITYVSASPTSVWGQITYVSNPPTSVLCLLEVFLLTFVSGFVECKVFKRSGRGCKPRPATDYVCRCWLSIAARKI